MVRQFLYLRQSPCCGGAIISMEMTASDIADLYEAMLYTRAARGIRPVLYVSSQKDLECSVLMLLDVAPETKLAGRWRPEAIGFRRRVMTN
jgi:hypothetical protein